jgi:chaperonin GroES
MTKPKQQEKNQSAKSRKIDIKPLGDRVLVKELKNEAGGETKSGIILPETVSQDRGAKQGEVMAVGEGRFEDGKLIPMKVRVGDNVLFQWGDEVKIDGDQYQIISESNILAVIR